MAKKRPNKAEREYMSKVANHGCIACEIDGKVSVPCEIHHIRNHTGMGLRPSHFDIIPLCPAHHSTSKISVHLNKNAFVERYGTEQYLQKKIKQRIDDWDSLTSIF